MADNSSGVLTSKDYKINKLDLITSHGKVESLSGIFTQLHIMQDVYSSVMSGFIEINDAQDIVGNFALNGNDFLKVDIEKPSLKYGIKKIFRIYKISERESIEGKMGAQKYVMHFCSEELILSNSMKVSKSYKGLNAASIVADVLYNYLKVDASRVVEVEDTSGNYDFVVPFYRPFEIIQWATARAYDLQPKFCYFFYENSDGYVFRSLQTLFSQTPMAKLRASVKQVNPDPSSTAGSVDKMMIINEYDVLTSISNGSYASRLMGVDIFSQQYKDYYYSLNMAESKKNLLNPHKQINDLKNANDESTLTCYDAYFTTYIQIDDTPTERQNSIEKWMMPRAMHLATLNSLRIRVVVPGDISIKAGDLVEYDFPKFKMASDRGQEKDPFRSGKYLVTSVNHKFMEDTFESILELSTDSFAAPLPEAADLVPILKKKD